MESKFLQSYRIEMNKLMNNQKDYEFENISLGIIAGSFKPPCKTDMERILDLSNQVDKVIIFLSNISRQKIENRELSLTNVKELGKIIHQINFLSDKTELEKIKTELNFLIENEQNLVFKKIKSILTDILVINSKNNKIIDLQNNVRNYLKKLEKNLFNSNNLTKSQLEISPETCKKIFEIFINAYNLNSKVEIRISKEKSPFVDQLNLIKHCKNCSIIISTTNENLKMEQNYENDISISTFNNNRTYHRLINLNVNNLKKEWFPEKISNEDFNYIQQLLRKKQNE